MKNYGFCTFKKHLKDSLLRDTKQHLLIKHYTPVP